MLDVIPVFLHMFDWHAAKAQTILFKLICSPFCLGVQGKSVGAPANPNGDRGSLFTCAVEAQLGIEGSNSSLLTKTVERTFFSSDFSIHIVGI